MEEWLGGCWALRKLGFSGTSLFFGNREHVRRKCYWHIARRRRDRKREGEREILNSKKTTNIYGF